MFIRHQHVNMDSISCLPTCFILVGSRHQVSGREPSLINKDLDELKIICMQSLDLLPAIHFI